MTDPVDQQAASEPVAVVRGDLDFCNKCGFFGTAKSDGAHLRPKDGEWCNYLAGRAVAPVQAASGAAGEEAILALDPQTMLAALINLHVDGTLSEGQVAAATGLDRVEIRRLADEVRGDAISPEVRRLVIAARNMAFGNFGSEEIKELDEASEAFAATVPWDDEPAADEQPS